VITDSVSYRVHVIPRPLISSRRTGRCPNCVPHDIIKECLSVGLYCTLRNFGGRGGFRCVQIIRGRVTVARCVQTAALQTLKLPAVYRQLLYRH
jgi:hypothetical protein